MDILDVDYIADQERENQCLIYCLSMTLRYLSSSHPNEWIRENVVPMEPDAVADYFSLGPRGWTPDKRSLRRLSNDVGPVKFEHSWKEYSPTEESFKAIIRNHLNDFVPAIPVVNIRLLRKSERGGVHAVLAIGMTENEIGFHDPWGYPSDKRRAKEFITAWDDVLNQVITVSLGGQHKLEDTSDLL